MRDAGVAFPLFGSSAPAEVSSPLSSVQSCKTQRSTPFLARQRVVAAGVWRRRREPRATRGQATWLCPAEALTASVRETPGSGEVRAG